MSSTRARTPRPIPFEQNWALGNNPHVTETLRMIFFPKSPRPDEAESHVIAGCVTTVIHLPHGGYLVSLFAQIQM